jgi:hypothetical protein
MQESCFVRGARLPRKSIQIPSVCCGIHFTGKYKITAWLTTMQRRRPFRCASLWTIKCIQRRPESALLIANLKSAARLPGAQIKAGTMTNKVLNATRTGCGLGVIMTSGGHAANLEWLQMRCVCFIHIQSYQQSNGSEFIAESATERSSKLKKDPFQYITTWNFHCSTVGSSKNVLRFVMFYFAECHSDVNNERGGTRYSS